MKRKKSTKSPASDLGPLHEAVEFLQRLGEWIWVCVSTVLRAFAEFLAVRPFAWRKYVFGHRIAISLRAIAVLMPLAIMVQTQPIPWPVGSADWVEIDLLVSAILMAISLAVARTWFLLVRWSGRNRHTPVELLAYVAQAQAIAIQEDQASVAARYARLLAKEMARGSAK